MHFAKPRTATPRALVPLAPRVATALCALLLAGCTVWQTGDVAPDVHNDRVHRGSESLAFDADSAVLVTGGWGGEVALWRAGQPAPEHVWQAHDASVQGVEFAGETIITGGYDGLLRAWDRAGTLLYEADTGQPIRRIGVMAEQVVTGHVDGSVEVRRLPGFELEHRFELHGGEVAAVAVHPPSGMFATSGFDGTVFLVTRAQPRRLTTTASDVVSLSFSDDAATLYGGGWRDLYRWSLPAGKLTRSPTPHWGYLAGLQYLGSNDTLATISRVNDSSVFFLDAASGEPIRHFYRQSICGSVVRVSPDGRFLATTGDDGAIRVWDLTADEAGTAALATAISANTAR